MFHRVPGALIVVGSVAVSSGRTSAYATMRLGSCFLEFATITPRWRLKIGPRAVEHDGGWRTRRRGRSALVVGLLHHHAVFMTMIFVHVGAAC